MSRIRNCVRIGATAALALTLGLAPQAALADTFSDVPRGSWYYDSVQHALDNHIFYGYSDGTFRPNQALTREEAAAVLYNRLGEDLIAPICPQTDVDQGAWYHIPVNWAVEMGVMNGYDSNTFGIGAQLTREQLACVIANAADADLSHQSTAILDSMPDGTSVSGWARKGVAWALENGVIHGVEGGRGSRRIDPQDTVDRATMAAVMMNADEAGLFGTDEPDVTPDEERVALCDSWATLYDDGELVFQKSDEIDVDRTPLWHGHGNLVHDSLLCRLRTVKITSRCGISLDDGDNHISFAHFVNLEDISGLSLWDVSKVHNFDSMFEGCIKLGNLGPLSHWDISVDVSLSNMFQHTKARLFPRWFVL